MEKIVIAVGSKRDPKLNAVTSALAAFSSALAPTAAFEVVGVEVESGVSHTPSSCEELMRGGPHHVYLRAVNCVRELV